MTDRPEMLLEAAHVQAEDEKAQRVVARDFEEILRTLYLVARKQSERLDAIERRVDELAEGVSSLETEMRRLPPEIEMLTNDLVE